MYLVIFVHPDNKRSHNAEILKHVKRRLQDESKEFEVIDLYEDNFDPVLRISPEPESKTMLVEKYKNLVKAADTLLFIFPVWWYNMPAILKGFIDIVFSPGILDEFDTRKGLRKMLEGKRAVIINTYGRSEEQCNKLGNPPPLILEHAVLEFCGISSIRRIDWFDVRAPFLIPEKIAKEISQALQ